MIRLVVLTKPVKNRLGTAVVQAGDDVKDFQSESNQQENDDNFSLKTP